MRFRNDFRIIPGKEKNQFSLDDFKNEISIYAASFDFIQANGGKISKELIKQIPKEYLALGDFNKLNIDIRVHHLEAEDFPASPGWHCDESKRETFFGQSVQDRVPVDHSCIFMISSELGGVSNTEFLNQEMEFEDCNLEGFDLWTKVNQALGSKKINTININDNEWVIFNEFNLHRVSPAKQPGYRVFMRLSFWDYEHDGSVSKFEQVYKTKW